MASAERTHGILLRRKPTPSQLTPLERADAYIAAGDLLSQFTLDRDGALRRYLQGWQVLAADPLLENARDERFAEPVLLNEIPRTTAPDMRNLFVRVSTVMESCWRSSGPSCGRPPRATPRQ